MNVLAQLLSGQNIPFLAALGCCVALAAMQIVAGLGDADADVDTGVDVDTDLDADIDPDIDVDADAEADAGSGALALLGVGQIPLMLILMVFLGCFGAIGLLANTIVAGLAGGYPGWALLAVLLLSALLALPLTGALGRQVARVAARSTTAVTSAQLVGRVGQVVSAGVSRSYGRVQVRDAHGSLHTVFAVADSDEPVPERSDVALVAYDDRERRYLVRRLQ